MISTCKYKHEDIYHLYGRILDKNKCLKLSLEYPMTA